MRCGSRASLKQLTTRPSSPILRSASRNSSAPPSVVSRSPVNSATTCREKCASNSNCDWLHCVIRKAALLLAFTTRRQRSYALDSGLFLLQIKSFCLFLVRYPGYHAEDFIEGSRKPSAIPHITEYEKRRRSCLTASEREGVEFRI